MNINIFNFLYILNTIILLKSCICTAFIYFYCIKRVAAKRKQKAVKAVGQ